MSIPTLAELIEHDLVNEQRRGDAEADRVRQRIELPPERAVLPAQPRQPAVEHVEHARAQDEPDGGRGNWSMARLRPDGLVRRVHRVRHRAGTCTSVPVMILSVAANPQNRLPAVIRFGSR